MGDAELADKVLALRAERNPNGDPRYTFEQIGEMLGISKYKARDVYHAATGRQGHRTVRVVEDYAVPLKTRAGRVWCRRVTPPRSSGRHRFICYKCELYEDCCEAVLRGDFIGCEWPIEKDLL